MDRRMRTLKNIISRYMGKVTCVLVAVVLIVIVYIQTINLKRQAYENTVGIFGQIQQLLKQNQEELNQVMIQYRGTCLHNAQAVAYMIQNDPSILESVENLKEIAEFMEVDEIHIFDETGRIFAGTHPEYYNYTFDSGEQMHFFKPMLEDRSLKLVQDIMPNTAEAKLMQYSALWSENQEFIVQIGMNPVNVMKAREKNELAYLFSMFRVNLGAGYYAVDAKSGEIIGATNIIYVGKNLTDMGFDLSSLTDFEKGKNAVVNGQNSYCIFKLLDSNYICRIISNQELYQRIPENTALFGVCLIAIALFLSYAVTKYMDRFVVGGIYQVNEKLHRITEGNLDEMVEIQSSAEFSDLSNYINRMKQSLLDTNRKMSYVLRKTNMYIGVYEYNKHMKRVRFTEYVPIVLSLNEAETSRLASDLKAFRKFIDMLRENPLPEEPGVYKWKGKYVKLEEIQENNEVCGVVIDVTEEITKRKKIEVERDIDALTNLYNRRGLELKLSALFQNPEILGCSAVVMMDADNLKMINDTYGHEMGDVYLKKISELVTNLKFKNSVFARLGGDEFVLFLYQYETEEELLDTIHALDYVQEDCFALLKDKIRVPLRFSWGYCLTKGQTDYQKLFKEADEKMYENKRKRKKRQRFTGL